MHQSDSVFARSYRAQILQLRVFCSMGMLHGDAPWGCCHGDACRRAVMHQSPSRQTLSLLQGLGRRVESLCSRGSADILYLRQSCSVCPAHACNDNVKAVSIHHQSPVLSFCKTSDAADNATCSIEAMFLESSVSLPADWDCCMPSVMTTRVVILAPYMIW